MGRKLPFLPTCGSPGKTLSFRAAITGDLQSMAMDDEAESSIESVIRGLSSDRLFFKPGRTSSILEEAESEAKEKEFSVSPFKESVSMMEIESTDPFVDFKKSMQEMLEADEGLKGWENLQELLSWYLAVNDKINHGYIIGAFVDLLLVNLGSPPSSSCSSSSSSSSSLSSINGQDQSLLMGSASNQKKMISSESPESALSFTSSSASSSGTCSSTSHCLSASSLEEEEEEDEDEDDEGHNSAAQKVVVSDDASSSSKV